MFDTLNNFTKQGGIVYLGVQENKYLLLAVDAHGCIRPLLDTLVVTRQNLVTVKATPSCRVFPSTSATTKIVIVFHFFISSLSQ